MEDLSVMFYFLQFYTVIWIIRFLLLCLIFILHNVNYTRLVLNNSWLLGSPKLALDWNLDQQKQNRPHACLKQWDELISINEENKFTLSDALCVSVRYWSFDMMIAMFFWCYTVTIVWWTDVWVDQNTHEWENNQQFVLPFICKTIIMWYMDGNIDYWVESLLLLDVSQTWIVTLVTNCLCVQQNRVNIFT